MTTQQEIHTNKNSFVGIALPCDNQKIVIHGFFISYLNSCLKIQVFYSLMLKAKWDSWKACSTYTAMPVENGTLTKQVLLIWG